MFIATSLFLNACYSTCVYIISDLVEQTVEHLLVSPDSDTTATTTTTTTTATPSIKATYKPAMKPKAPASSDDDEEVLSDSSDELQRMIAVQVAARSTGGSHHPIDYHRAVLFGSSGFIGGIIMFTWYNFIDWAWKPESAVELIHKAAFNQVFNPVYFMFIQGYNAQLMGLNIIEVWKHNLLPQILAALAFWFPVDLIMFGCIPEEAEAYWSQSMDLLFVPVVSYFSFRTQPPPPPPLAGRDSAGKHSTL